MNSVYDVILALRATNSKLEKQAVFERNKDDDLLKKVLFYTLNPYYQFNIRKLPEFEIQEETHGLYDVFPMLDRFRTRQVTGNAAVNEYAQMLSVLSEENREVLKIIIDKDLKAGCSTSTVNKVWKDLIPTFNPQLASGFVEKKFTIDDEDWVIEPKIDGMRCFAMVNSDGSVDFFSRGGKPINTLDHLIPELQSFGVSGVYDGEVMTTSFQESMSDIKRKTKKDNVDIFFHVFDYLTLPEWDTQKCLRPYGLRRDNLRTIYIRSQLDELKYVLINPFFEISSYEEAKDMYASFIDEGYEGAIVKRWDGEYEFKRTTDWMKIKPVETHDVEITGVQEGKGKYEGMMGALFYDWKGRTGRVGTGFSDEDRARKWEIGTIIEIELMEETELKEDGTGGIPRHSRFKKIRSYKGEKA